MKLFEFAAFYVPSDEDRKSGETPEVICSTTLVLAKDEKEALLKAARQVPSHYESKLDRVEICVRPF